MKIHSLENTGSISVDGVDIISLNPNGTIQLGTQTVYTAASYDEATATGGTITNQTIGNQIINGDLIVTGSLTAQQFIVSSSVTYLTTSFASGSTKFGDTLDDVHGFTGSLSISGSLIINGASYNTTTSGTSGTRGTSGSGGTSGSSGSSGESGIYIGTSTDTIDLSTLTVGVNKSLTTSVGLSYTIAQHVIVAYSLTQHFHGDVVSYNSGTGVLVLNVTDINTPTGTFSTWSTNLDGAAGGNGTSGTSGSSGVSGASGSSGATGSSGSAGTSGTSGTATTSTRVEQNFIATANQTTFTVTGGYTVGLVDVFVNGVRFLPTEYTATNGTTVVFNTGLMVNDEVTVLNYTSVIAALPTSRNVQDFTATAGQTTFTVTNGYIVGLLDVFVNGSKLTSSEFTATNGTTFVLTVASTVGDQVQSINYTASVNGVSGVGTTNELAYYTASSTLSSLTTSTYPSLTELSYVKGVTSAIQTQLNAKAATLSGTTNNISKFTSSSTIGNSLLFENSTAIGLNVTPKTWYSTINHSAIQIGQVGALTGGNDAMYVMSNYYFDASGAGKYISNGFASSYRQNAGEHTFFTAVSGSTDATTTMSQRMTITNGGNIGIATNSPSEKVVVYGVSSSRPRLLVGPFTTSTALYTSYNSQDSPAIEVNTSTTNGFAGLTMSNSDNTLGNTLGCVTFAAAGTSNGEKRGAIIGSGLESSATSSVSGNLIFYTAAASSIAERMRIKSNGDVQIGPQDSAVSTKIAVSMDGAWPNDVTGVHMALCGASDSRKRLVAGYDTTNNFGYIASGQWGVQWTSLYLQKTSGAVYAGSARIDNNSDVRIKDNIQPITGALEKVLSMTGKKFHMLDEPEDKLRLGFIAQELQGVVDELVIESDRTQKLPSGEVIENVLGLETWGSSWAALLVEAIKELSDKVTLLENK